MTEPVKRRVKVLNAEYVKEPDAILILGECQEGRFRQQISSSCFAFGDKDEMVFLGREISEQRNYSEKVAERIDEEVDIIIKGAQKNAEAILIKHRALLEKVAKDLDIYHFFLQS